jgi:hypothetical protein
MNQNHSKGKIANAPQKAGAIGSKSKTNEASPTTKEEIALANMGQTKKTMAVPASG